MLWSLLKGMFGVFLLILLWVGVQQFVRRKSPPMPPGCDEAERLHGCRHCTMLDSCDVRHASEEEKASQDDHAPADSSRR